MNLQLRPTGRAGWSNIDECGVQNMNLQLRSAMRGAPPLPTTVCCYPTPGDAPEGTDKLSVIGKCWWYLQHSDPGEECIAK
jgi:hypothetical protein